MRPPASAKITRAAGEDIVEISRVLASTCAAFTCAVWEYRAAPAAAAEECEEEDDGGGAHLACGLTERFLLHDAF